MTVALNPKPIAEAVVEERLGDLFEQVELDPNLIGAVRQVATVDALGLDDVSIGDDVYVRDRACNFKLLRTSVAKYLRVAGSSSASYDGNRLEITATTIGGTVALPVGAVIQCWMRIDTSSTLPVGSIDVWIHDQKFGFRTSSGQIRFEIGGGSTKLEVVSVETEDGTFQDSQDLAKNVWYLVTVRVTTSFTVSGSQKVIVGAFYANAITHYRDITIQGATIGGSPLTFYKNFEAGIADGMTASGTVTYPDAEDTSNGMDIVKLGSGATYKLWKVAPAYNWVTPQNLGAKRQLSTLNYSASVDSTAIIQHLIDSTYDAFIDGCYCVLGTLNITKPKNIFLKGEANLYKRITNGTVGCLYSGSTAVDMIRIFSEGVSIRGGALECRNAVYANRTDPYYCPPSLIKYCYFYNLIQSGEIRDIALIGSDTTVRNANGGHFGISVDCSNDYPSDPKVGFPTGFGEMHYVKCNNVKGTYLNRLLMASLEEPYQSYPLAAYSHTSSGGFLVSSSTVDSGTSPTTYTVASASGYTVGANLRRFFTIKWGSSDILSFRISMSVSIIDRINEAIANKGYSTDLTQNDVPAFKAESLPSGTNQSFRIRSNRNITSLKVFRPCLATANHFENFTSIGCKQACLIDTWTSGRLSGFLQTGNSLDTSEYELPLATIAGEDVDFDFHSVDLDKGNASLPTYRTNKKAWENLGSLNRPGKDSMASVKLGHVDVIGQIDPTTDFMLNPNSLYIVDAGTSPGKTGFIRHLENSLYLADQKYNVTTSHSNGSISGISNLFSNNSSGTTITYNSGFNAETGAVDIIIEPTDLELLSLFLLIGSTNTPKSVEVRVTGTSGPLTVSQTLVNSNQRFLVFEGYNQNNTTEVRLRLVGVKDKSQTVNLLAFMGRNKVQWPGTLPYLSTAGGRIYGDTKTHGLLVRKPNGTFARLSVDNSNNLTVANE